MTHYAAEYTHVLLAAMVCSLAAFLLCWFWHLASNELRRHGVAKTVLFIALSIPLAIRSVEKGGGDRGGGTSQTPEYSENGELARLGSREFRYDAKSRLVSVSDWRWDSSTNGYVYGVVVSNRYDHLDRRVQKITPEATHTFFYDGWMLVKEIVANANGMTDVIEYHWGKDLSGSLGGAGGVGGLLYLTISNASTHQLYVPFYDNKGNVMGYWDAQGNIVAEYTYDAFGNTIASSGPMPNAFAIRYSTKHFDPELNLYYYGYRFYSPELKRWITRDPIGEEGGVNLYLFLYNNSLSLFDLFGCRTYKLGWHGEPRVNFDNDFPFDPTAKATIGDYWNWAKWKTKLNGARLIGHLEDGTLMYQHYLEGTGTPMTVDYMKAYREDSGIATSVRNAVREAQREAERLAKAGGCKFEMSSDAGNADKYPTTENWQKAIGGHSLWGEAQVYNCKDKFSMQITIHAIDRYNFNKGALDIATGAPDNENGRFGLGKIIYNAWKYSINSQLETRLCWRTGGRC